jgi:hypothetical protein
MPNLKKLTTDELMICADSIYESLTDNEARSTLLSNDASFYGDEISSLEYFLEEIADKEEFDLIKPLDYDRYDLNNVKEERWCNQYLSRLPGFIIVCLDLPPQCLYGPRIDTFLECYSEYADRLEPYAISTFCRKPGLYRKDPAYNVLRTSINDFIKDLRNRLRDKCLRKKIRDQHKAVEDNCEEFSNFTLTLFKTCSRLVVIRSDFGYKKKFDVTIEDIKKDIGRFFRNRRHNKRIFGHMKGYIAKIEYGEAKGPHVHLILFYDGSKRNNHSDSYFAKEIGI